MSVEEYKQKMFEEQTMALHVAAGLLGVSIARMKELVYQGEVQGIIMFDGAHRIDRASLMRYARTKKEEEAG